MRCFRFPAIHPAAIAIEQRQRALRVLAGAPGDLLMQPMLAEIAAADAVRELLQVFGNLLDTPATADIVADNAVKHVATIGSGRSAGPHDLLDFVNAVFGTVAVEAVSEPSNLCRGFRGCRLAAFCPDDAPVDHAVDVGELTNGVELVAGDGQRFVGAAEQLDSDFFAVDLQREFLVQARLLFVRPQMRQPVPDGVTSE